MLSLQPSNHQGCHGEVHTGMPHKVACNKQVPCDVQAQCCKWPQLLHSCVNHCSKNKRQKTLTGTILLISPYMYISICVYTHTHTYIRGFPNGSAVKNLPTMGKLQKIWVQFLDWEDSPGGGHSNPLYYYSLENTKYRGACRLQSIRLQVCKGSNMTEMMISPHIYHTYLDEFLEPKI